MPISNRQIADMFNEMADLLDIEGENPFRIRAYRNAARVIDGLSENVAQMIIQGKDLTELPTIGDAIAKKIKIMVKTGKLPQLETEAKKFPAFLRKLTQISGVGPRKIKAIYDAFHIETMSDLKKLIADKKIRTLRGFGEKTENLIKLGLVRVDDAQKRVSIATAERIAEPLVAYLQEHPLLQDIEVAGSYRRKKETVGDLDILITATKGAAIIDHFVKYDDVSRVISKGATRSAVLLKSGIQVDLRVVPKISYGAALYYFTGSKPHNIAVRQMAVKKHLKINEYGVFKGKKRIAGKTEQEIFKQVGLDYIEPELRENNGEIETALKHKLPKLITLEDIRGDLHCHTKATDGQYSIEEMVKAAQQKGYEYIAITDHSKHLALVKGLDKKRLLAQIKYIDRLNEKLKKFTVLKSIEVDILENGELDLPDDVLKDLDLTVCSVHSKFNLSKKKQTERILRAMENPYFNILGHPTARLINKRDAYDIDLEKIFTVAKELGCCLEINAQPERMDLNDRYCRLAKDLGVKMVISTDAHSIHHFNHMRFGIYQARRGWLEAKDVINTRSLKELKRCLVR